MGSRTVPSYPLYARNSHIHYENLSGIDFLNSTPWESFGVSKIIFIITV